MDMVNDGKDIRLDTPQGVSLKQAAMEAREASAKLFDKNVGADSPTRRDER